MARLTTTPATMLAAFFIFGCAQTTDESTDALEVALTGDFGGFDDSDEPPFFGEQTTFEDLEEADEDPMESYDEDPVAFGAGREIDEDVRHARGEGGPGPRPGGPGEPGSQIAGPMVYAVHVSWGRHRFDPNAEDGTRWNPVISTECGRMVVRHRVAMEGEEGVIRPRENAQTVALRSSTRPHMDGVALLLSVRPDEYECAQNGLFRIETAESGALEIPLIEGIGDLAMREDMGGGNHVVVLAHRIEPEANGECQRGVLAGRWRRHVDRDGGVRGNLGRFRGRVLNELGDLRGHVKGIWGKPGRGRHQNLKVYFGKFIQKDGKFMGLLAGRYGDGGFEGGWHLGPRAEFLHGGMGGHYTTGSDDEPDGGLFYGRYASRACQRPIDALPLENLP